MADHPVLTALCALVGGLVGSYFVGYFKEKGKNFATYEDIKTLLAQERGKAYEQEKGKRLATTEDIAHVLSEIKLVTEQTETIKAQISSDLWTSQMIWNQKKDAYGTILKNSHSLSDSLRGLLSVLKLGDDDASYKDGATYQADNLKARGFFGETIANFYNSLTEAEIFIDKNGTLLLNKARKDLIYPQTSDDCFRLLVLLQNWNSSMIANARSELRISKTNSPGSS